MTVIRREVVIAVVEDIEHESFGVEVTVPENMSTLEAVGLMEIGRAQYLRTKHDQGPTVYMTSDVEAPRPRLRECVERWPGAYTGGTDGRCCRFPKTCSADIYADGIDPAALEGGTP